MDEFKRYVAKQNSFLIYGKTKLYEISITWIEKKNATCFMLIKIISVKTVKKCWHCFIVDILWKNG